MATDILNLGSRAPDFNLLGTDSETYSYESFLEKEAFVIIFSCNHCPYVIAYEDRMIAIQNDYPTVQLLVINSNDSSHYPDDSYENMIERAREKKYNFPYLRDEDQSVARNFGATHTPEIFLLDKNKTLVFHGKIDENWQEPKNAKEKYLRNALDEIITGSEITLPETFTIGCTIKWK